MLSFVFRWQALVLSCLFQINYESNHIIIFYMDEPQNNSKIIFDTSILKIIIITYNFEL